MLYQFIGWQLSRPRKMYLGSAETTVVRMKKTQHNFALPLQIGTFKELQEFAACFSIIIPNNEAVFRAAKVGIRHPTADWLVKEYERFVTHLSSTEAGREILATPVPEEEKIAISEGTKICSVPSQQILPLTSTNSVLQSSSQTVSNPSPSLKPPR